MDVLSLPAARPALRSTYGSVEYDRGNLGSHLSTLGHYLNMPGRLVHARVDYAAEFLPLVILREPAVSDIWGNPLSPNQKTVPGMAITPLGFRWLWRDGKTIKPLWTIKMGGVVFTQKALSTKATYANFTINSALGLQARLTPRIDLRIANEFHHFSNLYVNTSNPGLDALGIIFGIVYHLPASGRW
ncbi:MAG: acyloxyacyl hydrolase [Terracidiphilus sp.]